MIAILLVLIFCVLMAWFLWVLTRDILHVCFDMAVWLVKLPWRCVRGAMWCWRTAARAWRWCEDQYAAAELRSRTK